MGGVRYFILFVLAVLAFIGTYNIIGRAADMLFIAELYLLLALLIVAAVAMFLAKKRPRAGNLVFAILFLIFLADAALLIMQAPVRSYSFYLMLSASALGFVVSISGVRRKRCPRLPPVEVTDIEEQQISEIIKESERPAKKTTKKSTKKNKKSAKTKKKTAKKKSAKKASAKKAKKSTKKKPGRPKKQKKKTATRAG